MHAAPARRQGRGWLQLQLLAGVVVVAIAMQPVLAPAVQLPAFSNGATVFVSVVVQALPFLAFGILVSGSIAAFVPPSLLRRALPKRPALAVPVAGIAGVALPGCECASVPVASRLVENGVAPAAAFAFLLSAPAINPVVLVSTAVAFPGRPELVGARAGASLLTAVVVGLLWLRLGRGIVLPRPRGTVTSSGSRWQLFAVTAQHDFLQAGGFLVLGAVAAAALQTLVPRSVLDSVGGVGISAVVVMAALAVLLAVCSEADAFIAASLTSFSLTSRLVFLVVGPAVDVKLVALQVGTFGPRFALRFAPLTLVVAVLSAVGFGTWLL